MSRRKKQKVNTEENKKILKQSSDFNIMGSIATLRDSIYILKNPVIEGDFYKIQKGEKTYLVEKDICIDLIKITKPDEKNYIIYPYHNGKIIDVSRFQLRKEDSVDEILNKTHYIMFKQAIKIFKNIFVILKTVFNNFC